MSLTPTPQQCAILDAACSGGDLVIEAGAGTGKTSTLQMVAGARPRLRVLYLAYNKAIATEAAGRFGRNVTCRTAHSVAYGAVGYRFRDRLSAPRMPATVIAQRMGITQALDLGSDAKPVRPKHLARLAMAAVERFCRSADFRIGVQHVAEVPGYTREQNLELCAEVVRLAGRAWRDLVDPDGELRFTHDVYLKLWSLSQPRLRFDLVLLDEAQDADPAIAGVVDVQDHAQRIAAGDRCQALYGWRGAVDAMSGWGWPRLELSQSFRFGPPIAAAANEWLGRLGAQLRLTGTDSITSRVGAVGWPEAILARTNAGAVAAALGELKAERATAVTGGIDAVVALARAASDLRAGRGTDHPELFAFTNWAELQDYAQNDPGGSDLAAFVRLIDTYGPARVISLQSALCPEGEAEVTVSTGHKAKGREWPTVQIFGDFIAPKLDDDDDDVVEIPRAEAMLAYVAVTRARHAIDARVLEWVDQFPFDQAMCPLAPIPPDAQFPPPAPIVSTWAGTPMDPHEWLMGAPR